MMLYMHCAVCFLFDFSVYFIMALDSFFITTDNCFCSLIGHMGMHGIVTECVDGNVATACICFDAFYLRLIFFVETL